MGSWDRRFASVASVLRVCRYTTGRHSSLRARWNTPSSGRLRLKTVTSTPWRSSSRISLRMKVSELRGNFLRT